MLILVLLVASVYGESKGAKSGFCDVLGICSHTESGAYKSMDITTSFTTISQDINSHCTGGDISSGYANPRNEPGCEMMCREDANCKFYSYWQTTGWCKLTTSCNTKGKDGNANYKIRIKEKKSTSDGAILCPKGMHLVEKPVRSDDYYVGTADLGVQNAPTHYIPGQLLDIHIRVRNPYKKFLGLLMYAVQDNGEIGASGCKDGCNGNSEVKIGGWEETVDEFFKTTCANTEGVNQGITHKSAVVKNFHHVFQWRAPKAGSGDAIFRVLIKQGSTNGGFFYWPMKGGDLRVQEGAVVEQRQWVQGKVSDGCSKTCADENMECDRKDSLTKFGTLDFYSEFKGSHACQLPLLSTCDNEPASRDSLGYCYLNNKNAGNCPSNLNSQTKHICDSVKPAEKGEDGSEESFICPCIAKAVVTAAPGGQQGGVAGGSVAGGIPQSDTVTSNLKFNGDYATLVGSNKAQFLKECSAALYPLKCTDVWSGIYVKVEGKPADVDSRTKIVQTTGLVLPSFPLLGGFVSASTPTKVSVPGNIAAGIGGILKSTQAAANTNKEDSSDDKLNSYLIGAGATFGVVMLIGVAFWACNYDPAPPRKNFSFQSSEMSNRSYNNRQQQNYNQNQNHYNQNQNHYNQNQNHQYSQNDGFNKNVSV